MQNMVKRVDSGRQLDHDALLRYASAHVPGFPASPSSFYLSQDRVIGILDWELSTLGNQMCDIASSSMSYFIDLEADARNLVKGVEFNGVPEGITSQAEYLAEYCSASGKPWPATEWKFYTAFGLFRGATIFAGIHSRWMMGNASAGEGAQDSGDKANALNFWGAFPVEIGNLKSINGPNLSHNSLTGSIPMSPGNLNNLEWLDLSANKFGGVIPQQSLALTSLAVLNLPENQLTGQIPTGRQFNTFNVHHHHREPTKRLKEIKESRCHGGEQSRNGAGLALGVSMGNIFLSLREAEMASTIHGKRGEGYEDLKEK